MNEWMIEWTNEWINERINEWNRMNIDGLMDGWMGEERAFMKTLVNSRKFWWWQSKKNYYFNLNEKLKNNFDFVIPGNMN